MLVVGPRWDGQEPLLERGSYLLDPVQMRCLVVFLFLIVDLLAVQEDLQDTADARRQSDGYAFASLGEQLGGNPCRRTVVRSRNAVDDLRTYRCFTSHSKPPFAFLYDQVRPWLILKPGSMGGIYHSIESKSIMLCAAGRLQDVSQDGLGDSLI